MTNRLRLITPDESFAESYQLYVQELEELGEKPLPFTLGYESRHFSELILRLKNDALGIDLQDWQVPCSTFWLVDEGSQIIGVSNLRHKLNDKLCSLGGHIGYGIRPTARRKGYGTVILCETLKKAKDMGITKVLITCDKSNTGSIQVIKNNGGVLQDEEYIESEKDIVQRYWINL